MASELVAPTEDVPSIQGGNATVVLTWAQKHERIILTVIVLAAVLWLGNHWLTNLANADTQKATVATQTLAAQKTKDEQLAAQTAQAAAQNQALLAGLSQQNAAILASASTRTVVLQKQQVADTSLPLPDLGTRWVKLASLAPGDIVATPSGITVTDTGARQTVTLLERIPVLEKDKLDSGVEVSNLNQEVASQAVVGDDLKAQVAGLNTQIADQQKVCKTQIDAANAKARKSKVGWFVKGLLVGAGAVAVLAIHGV